MLDLSDALILATCREGGPLANTAAERTGLSRVAVSRRIQKLAQAGYIERHGSGTRPTYTLGDKRFWLQTTTPEAVAQTGGEFGHWEQHIAPLLQGVRDNVVNLANIAYTEMLNNALDHAQGTQLVLGAHLAAGRLQMLVADNGLGVFRRIAQALNLFDDRLAVLELAKGKFTTAAQGHSGMGVFVATRMLDGLAIHSKNLTYDLNPAPQKLPAFEWVDVHKIQTALAHNATGPGTLVRMDLVLDTDRTAQSVYNRYFSPDEVGGDAFHTTEIPVRLAQLSSQLTSRSQGKWVVERATQFKTLVLDFEEVQLVGQGFVDEVFRVFALANPHIQLRPVNMDPDVAHTLKLFAPHVAL